MALEHVAFSTNLSSIQYAVTRGVSGRSYLSAGRHAPVTFQHYQSSLFAAAALRNPLDIRDACEIERRRKISGRSRWLAARRRFHRPRVNKCGFRLLSMKFGHGFSVRLRRFTQMQTSSYLGDCTGLQQLPATRYAAVWRRVGKLCSIFSFLPCASGFRSFLEVVSSLPQPFLLGFASALTSVVPHPTPPAGRPRLSQRHQNDSSPPRHAPAKVVAHERSRSSGQFSAIHHAAARR